ncbi:MAG: class I SAM-dependent methyltransferase [Gammaproteobacteria bacterium]|jgi:predicted O-methyltransferase YrrM
MTEASARNRLTGDEWQFNLDDMSCTLNQPTVRRLLEQMHSEADRVDPPLLERAKGKGGTERAALLSEAFIPVDRDAGRLLYALARNAPPGLCVEFGTSFGISTIYLAAAARDRGGGTVITTEIDESKANRAQGYLENAGLLEYVDLRVGDALETLSDIDPDVTFVFIDGMKELYLPVLRLLEPALRPGTLVVGDDIELFPKQVESYLAYVRDPGSSYVSVLVPIGDGMELSVRN